MQHIVVEQDKLTPKEWWLNSQTIECNISTRGDIDFSTSTRKVVLFLATDGNIAHNELAYK